MYKEKKVVALIAAGGVGQRVGGSQPKQFIEIEEKSIIEHAIEAFIQSASIDDIYVISKEELIPDLKEILPSHILDKVSGIVAGGGTRQESVLNGLNYLIESDENYLSETNYVVLVHDAARPYITPELIENVVAGVYEYDAVIPVMPVKDTIKQIKDNVIVSTPNREELYAAQTPQGFDLELLKFAYDKAKSDGFVGTDDAQLVEYAGTKVHIIEGDNKNIKITTVDDLPSPKRVVGLGFDVHAFEIGRPLILGGIDIPYDKGLLGHSDADVLTHALMDAMLGAMNLGDIGTNFPDNDMKYKDISSIFLLNKVVGLMEEKGYIIENADLVIVAEKPKMKDYIPSIEQNLAKVLNTDISRISIKATTTEGLGFTGREEGIGSQAIVQLISEK